MKVGYARTSTVEQVAGLEAQIRQLNEAGVEELFQEQLSSVDSLRLQLTAALKFIRKGDTLVVTKIDRLARSVADLVSIEYRLKQKGAGLLILDLNIDTNTPTGRLQFNIFASVAQFEREIMLERQRAGIAKAKAEGKYKGRKPTAKAKTEEVKQLASEGLGLQAIAAKVGIGRTSVYRILNQ